MAYPAGCDVKGWAAIGEVVDRSAHQAMRYSRRDDDPMPVYRYGRDVYARTEELAEWQERQTTKG